MYCTSCGKENANDAAFCAYCGKPVTQSENASSTSNSDWEFCQIQTFWKDITRESCLGFFLRAYSWQYECYFWADAVGKNGPYCAASSPKYKIYGRVWAWDEAANPPFGNKEKDTKMSRQILDNLVNSLIKEGWQMLSERGAHVWQYKLKRKISA